MLEPNSLIQFRNTDIKLRFSYVKQQNNSGTLESSGKNHHVKDDTPLKTTVVEAEDIPCLANEEASPTETISVANHCPATPKADSLQRNITENLDMAASNIAQTACSSRSISAQQHSPHLASRKRSSVEPTSSSDLEHAAPSAKKKKGGKTLADWLKTEGQFEPPGSTTVHFDRPTNQNGGDSNNGRARKSDGRSKRSRKRSSSKGQEKSVKKRKLAKRNPPKPRFEVKEYPVPPATQQTAVRRSSRIRLPVRPDTTYSFIYSDERDENGFKNVLGIREVKDNTAALHAATMKKKKGRKTNRSSRSNYDKIKSGNSPSDRVEVPSNDRVNNSSRKRSASKGQEKSMKKKKLASRDPPKPQWEVKEYPVPPVTQQAGVRRSSRIRLPVKPGFTYSFIYSGEFDENRFRRVVGIREVKDKNSAALRAATMEKKKVRKATKPAASEDVSQDSRHGGSSAVKPEGHEMAPGVFMTRSEYLPGVSKAVQGLFTLEPHVTKPVRTSGDGTLSCLVLEGVVELTLMGEKVTLPPRSHFQVPYYNEYGLRNTTDENA